MTENKNLADLFEDHRSHLRGVAFRMLGSLSEADDAVQETWLKVSRSDTSAVENMRAWLTTIVARACLDMLRSRKLRREDPVGTQVVTEREAPHAAGDPGVEAQLASSVGLAMLVVLEMLDPAERVAFVLHDMFAVPYDEIASLVGRTPEATRQLASRARRRVQGAPEPLAPDVERQRKVVDAFLAASRAGDFDALVAVLDPDIVLRYDDMSRLGGPAELRGAREVASRAHKGGARAAQAALVDGNVGVIIAPLGRLLMVLRFTVENDKVVAVDAIGDPARVAELELSLLP